jgi:hypothetical protein
VRSGKTLGIKSGCLEEMPNLPRLRFALTAFCVGMIVIHGFLFWVVRHQLVSGSSDFRIFYTAGLMLRRGEGRVLYSKELQTRIQREFVSTEGNRIGALPYNHPPFEALAYVPLTYLPYFAAYGVWCVINILLVAGSIYQLRSWLPTMTEHFRWLLILTPLAFFPSISALLQGQDSLLLLALYCLAFAAFRRREDLKAGGYLGLGLFKFHLVLPFAFVLLLHRRSRALAGMSVIAGVQVATSWLLVGGKELLRYPEFALQINRQQDPSVIAPSNMANLRGLFMGWDSMNPPPVWLELALLGASIGLVLWASRQWRPAELLGAWNWDRGFSLCMVVSYLVGFHSYNHDMSFLLLPLLLALDRALDGWHETSMGLKVVLGLMFLNPLYLLLTIRLAHENLFSIVLLALAVYLAVFEARAEPQALVNRNRESLDAPLP